MNRRYTMVLAAVLIMAGVAGTAAAQGVSEDAEIWTGDRIVFTKEDGADPTDPANQDRITESVWITRRNDGGQIYNIQQEQRPNKGRSPVATEWAVGTLDDLENLRFTTFRRAVSSPRDIAGTTLVMHIVPEDIYLEVEFLSWSSQKRGGFSYERTTP